MTTDHMPQAPRPSFLRFALGLSSLALCLLASAALAAKHLHLFQAPGCGAGGGCDQAAGSIFGSVPLIGWPLSHFGLAWFTVLIVTWTATFRGASVSKLFRLVVRLGAVGSLVYIGAMAFGGYLCPYCLAVHAGNFAFLFVEAGAPRTSGTPLAFAGRGALVFALITGALVGAEAFEERSAEEERQESTQQMINAMGDAPISGGTPFVGRYARGPERAPIRVVSFIDYSCGYCQKIEEQANRLAATRDDVQLSIKHYPLCSDCNQYVTARAHPDACRAAIAAETAGLLGGGEAFWAISHWLFARGGAFTDAELRVYLENVGLDAEAFLVTMEGDEAKALVEADIGEANSLGVFGTPVVYINGVELRGFHADEALVRAVEDLEAAGLPAGEVSVDRPASAAAKHISDWRANPGHRMVRRPEPWVLGADEESTDKVVEIELFGDYLVAQTVDADRAVRELVGRRTDVRYYFRHFPIHTDCNPISQRILEAESCLAHRATEAAGMLDGEAGYWSMHDWLLGNQEGFDAAALQRAVLELGLDAEAFEAALASPLVDKLIEFDCREAARVQLYYTPAMAIDGRKVPSWKQEGILDVLVDEARDNPPPRISVDGQVAQFRQAPVQRSSIEGGMTVGPANAPAEIVLWGDLRSGECAAADRTLQQVFGRRKDVRYRFRHFPVDTTCNPNVESTLHEEACLAHRALEAASKTGGIIGYWRMHGWLMRNQRGLDSNGLRSAATSAGIDLDTFLGWLDHADVAAVIEADQRAAAELGVREAPTVFLNDRRVPNWSVGGLLDRLIDEVVSDEGR